MKKIFYVFLIFINFVLAQDQSKIILDKVKSNFDLINDYSVEVIGKIQIPKAEIPDIKAKIYYKKPDKFHIESEGFSILPKRIINFDPQSLFGSNFKSLLMGEKEIDGKKHFEIKIIPDDSLNPNSLITVYVDSKNFTVRKIILSGTGVKKIESDLFFKLIDNKFWMPEKIETTFEFNLFRFPRFKKMNKELNNQSNLPQQGVISLIYSNYVINNGIDDKIFKNK